MLKLAFRSVAQTPFTATTRSRAAVASLAIPTSQVSTRWIPASGQPIKMQVQAKRRLSSNSRSTRPESSETPDKRPPKPQPTPTPEVHIHKITDFELFGDKWLRAEYGAFGEVLGVDVTMRKKRAVVQFVDKSSAEQAIEAVKKRPEYAKLNVRLVYNKIRRVSQGVQTRANGNGEEGPS